MVTILIYLTICHQAQTVVGRVRPGPAFETSGPLQGQGQGLLLHPPASPVDHLPIDDGPTHPAAHPVVDVAHQVVVAAALPVVVVVLSVEESAHQTVVAGLSAVVVDPPFKDVAHIAIAALTVAHLVVADVVSGGVHPIVGVAHLCALSLAQIHYVMALQS